MTEKIKTVTKKTRLENIKILDKGEWKNNFQSS